MVGARERFDMIGFSQYELDYDTEQIYLMVNFSYPRYGMQFIIDAMHTNANHVNDNEPSKEKG